MFLYFFFIRIAALFGHKKAKALVKGQKETLSDGQKERLASLRGAVWIHAASVGEFEQARTIIEKLKIKKSKLKIVVTFYSPSGYEARKNYEQVDGVFYLPFATRIKAKRFLEALQPKMAIFVKYEFWPAYLRELKKRAIPTYSICSIFRPQQRFFRWYSFGSLRLLHCFTHLYVQDEESRRLLAEHGVHEASVAGDTRFDRVKEVMENTDHFADGIQSTDRFRPIAEFVEGCERVLVAGSTWPEDEALLKKYMRTDRSTDRIQNTDQITKLILVPHEINEEHLHYLFNLFQGRIVSYSSLSTDRFTDRVQNTDLISSRRNILQKADVLLIDTIGLLSSIYRFGQVAYIGGGFGVGIHNTIEAAVYGVPVLFGPNFDYFREAKGLIDSGAARSIRNYDELEEAIETAFAQHEEMGAKAAAYVESELGATEKIYKEIFS
jgi:3-deoxy-D-manno-octulosonic-acid transferase